MGGIKGGPVSVEVGPARPITPEEEITRKMRHIMVGRVVNDVVLEAEQIVFKMADGGMVSMSRKSISGVRM
jgi:hypothetical protein